MKITDNMRKSFDDCANGAIDAAQAMIKANPDIKPTDAYRLAISFAMELWVTSFMMQIEFIARNYKEKE